MTTAVEERQHSPTAAETATDTQNKVRVRVSELLQGGREAILEHDGKDYRLRITANDKLILTK